MARQGAGSRPGWKTSAAWSPGPARRLRPRLPGGSGPRLPGGSGPRLPGEQGEEAAVGRVHVHPGPVPAGDRQDLVHRVDGTQAGGAGGGNHRADPAPGEQRVECRGIHPPRAVGGHRGALDAEHAAHPGMGVVRLLAVGDAEAGMGFPGHVKGLQVGDRAAGGQVAEVGAQPEHGGQRSDRLLFHLAGRGTAVQRVVVRVDQHRGEIAGHRSRVRGLEHLAGVGRVEERIVAVQPPGEFGEGAGEPLVADEHRRVGLERPEPLLPLRYRRDGTAQPALQVHPETVPPPGGRPRRPAAPAGPPPRRPAAPQARPTRRGRTPCPGPVRRAGAWRLSGVRYRC